MGAWIIRDLHDALSRGEMLARIRDLMRDSQDKQILRQSLSSVAHGARDLSHTVHDSVNQTLAGLTRPGIAIDVSKLRDLAGEAAKMFDSCDPSRDIRTK